ncbi:MAG: hypothetical protein QOG80_3143 [Pseudonocardiales bacterium]|jgi:Flp pilus assembly protein TadG|nr:hypothetical protein [Pseudonocardiales bacterium]
MRRGDDRGASVVEFVLIATLLVFLLFAVMQVGLYVYARNIAAAAAADGARYAAASGVEPPAGAHRADDLMRSGLHGVAAAIPCLGSAGVDAVSGLTTTTVECHGRLRASFLPLAFPLRIDVLSSALRERAP